MTQGAHQSVLVLRGPALHGDPPGAVAARSKDQHVVVVAVDAPSLEGLGHGILEVAHAAHTGGVSDFGKYRGCEGQPEDVIFR